MSGTVHHISHILSRTMLIPCELLHCRCIVGRLVQSIICRSHLVTVGIDGFGNILWIRPLAPGTSSDVLIWDREGPQRAKGHFKDYGLVPLMTLIKAVYTRLCLSLGSVASQNGNKRKMMFMDIIGVGCNICSVIGGIGVWCAIDR